MPPKTVVMTEKKIKAVKLGDNREVRVVRIPTGFGENLIRLGVVLLPGEENLSGAVFPESKLDEVIEALQGAKRG